jgi:hypothetical protein
MGFYGALIGRDVVLDEEGDAAHAKQSSTADRISTINLHAYVGYTTCLLRMQNSSLHNKNVQNYVFVRP